MSHSSGDQNAKGGQSQAARPAAGQGNQNNERRPSQAPKTSTSASKNTPNDSQVREAARRGPGGHLVQKNDGKKQNNQNDKNRDNQPGPQAAPVASAPRNNGQTSDRRTAAERGPGGHLVGNKDNNKTKNNDKDRTPAVPASHPSGKSQTSDRRSAAEKGPGGHLVAKNDKKDPAPQPQSRQAPSEEQVREAARKGPGGHLISEKKPDNSASENKGGDAPAPVKGTRTHSTPESSTAGPGEPKTEARSFKAPVGPGRVNKDVSVAMTVDDSGKVTDAKVGTGNEDVSARNGKDHATVTHEPDGTPRHTVRDGTKSATNTGVGNGVSKDRDGSLTSTCRSASCDHGGKNKHSDLAVKGGPSTMKVTDDNITADCSTDCTGTGRNKTGPARADLRGGGHIDLSKRELDTRGSRGTTRQDSTLGTRGSRVAGPAQPDQEGGNGSTHIAPNSQTSTCAGCTESHASDSRTGVEVSVRGNGTKASNGQIAINGDRATVSQNCDGGACTAEARDRNGTSARGGCEGGTCHLNGSIGPDGAYFQQSGANNDRFGRQVTWRGQTVNGGGTTPDAHLGASQVGTDGKWSYQEYSGKGTFERPIADGKGGLTTKTMPGQLETQSNGPVRVTPQGHFESVAADGHVDSWDTPADALARTVGRAQETDIQPGQQPGQPGQPAPGGNQGAAEAFDALNTHDLAAAALPGYVRGDDAAKPAAATARAAGDALLMNSNILAAADSTLTNSPDPKVRDAWANLKDGTANSVLGALADKQNQLIAAKQAGLNTQQQIDDYNKGVDEYNALLGQNAAAVAQRGAAMDTLAPALRTMTGPTDRLAAADNAVLATLNNTTSPAVAAWRDANLGKPGETDFGALPSGGGTLVPEALRSVGAAPAWAGYHGAFADRLHPEGGRIPGAPDADFIAPQRAYASTPQNWATSFARTNPSLVRNEAEYQALLRGIEDIPEFWRNTPANADLNALRARVPHTALSAADKQKLDEQLGQDIAMQTSGLGDGDSQLGAAIGALMADKEVMPGRPLVPSTSVSAGVDGYLTTQLSEFAEGRRDTSEFWRGVSDRLREKMNRPQVPVEWNNDPGQALNNFGYDAGAALVGVPHAFAIEVKNEVRDGIVYPARSAWNGQWEVSPEWAPKTDQVTGHTESGWEVAVRNRPFSLGMAEMIRRTGVKFIPDDVREGGGDAFLDVIREGRLPLQNPFNSREYREDPGRAAANDVGTLMLVLPGMKGMRAAGRDAAKLATTRPGQVAAYTGGMARTYAANTGRLLLNVGTQPLRALPRMAGFGARGVAAGAARMQTFAARKAHDAGEPAARANPGTTAPRGTPDQPGGTRPVAGDAPAKAGNGWSRTSSAFGAISRGIGHKVADPAMALARGDVRGAVRTFRERTGDCAAACRAADRQRFDDGTAPPLGREFQPGAGGRRNVEAMSERYGGKLQATTKEGLERTLADSGEGTSGIAIASAPKRGEPDHALNWTVRDGKVAYTDHSGGTARRLADDDPAVRGIHSVIQTSLGPKLRFGEDISVAKPSPRERFGPRNRFGFGRNTGDPALPSRIGARRDEPIGERAGPENRQAGTRVSTVDKSGSSPDRRGDAASPAPRPGEPAGALAAAGDVPAGASPSSTGQPGARPNTDVPARAADDTGHNPGRPVQPEVPTGPYHSEPGNLPPPAPRPEPRPQGNGPGGSGGKGPDGKAPGGKPGDDLAGGPGDPILASGTLSPGLARRLEPARTEGNAPNTAPARPDNQHGVRAAETQQAAHGPPPDKAGTQELLADLDSRPNPTARLGKAASELRQAKKADREAGARLRTLSRAAKQPGGDQQPLAVARAEKTRTEHELATARQALADAELIASEAGQLGKAVKIWRDHANGNLSTHGIGGTRPARVAATAEVHRLTQRVILSDLELAGLIRRDRLDSLHQLSLVSLPVMLRAAQGMERLAERGFRRTAEAKGIEAAERSRRFALLDRAAGRVRGMAHTTLVKATGGDRALREYRAGLARARTELGLPRDGRLTGELVDNAFAGKLAEVAEARNVAPEKLTDRATASLLSARATLRGDLLVRSAGGVMPARRLAYLRGKAERAPPRNDRTDGQPPLATEVFAERIGEVERASAELSSATTPEQRIAVRDRYSEPVALLALIADAWANLPRHKGQRLNKEEFAAALAMLDDKIIKMDTGEGKTEAAMLAAFAAALDRGPGAAGHVDVITHLAESTDKHVALFDAVARELRERTGLEVTVGRLPDSGTFADAFLAHRKQVTIGTDTAFGFDELTNSLNERAATRDARPDRTIVDEADHVMVDEGTTQLILSGATREPVNTVEFTTLAAADRIAELVSIDPAWRSSGRATLTGEHLATLRKLGHDLTGRANAALRHRVENALTARTLNPEGKLVDYAVLGDEIVILNNVTGKQMPGRRWSDGLAQAVEYREFGRSDPGKVRKDTESLAATTMREYLRGNRRIAGATATPAAEAFRGQYGIETYQVPRHIRDSGPETKQRREYHNEASKQSGAIGEAVELAGRGEPVLLAAETLHEVRAYAARIREADGVEVMLIEETSSKARIDAALERARRPGAIALQIVDHLSSEAWVAKAVSRGGKPGVLTVGSARVGRGANFRVDKLAFRTLRGAEPVLHARATKAMPPRVEKQLAGRAGRQTDRGTFRVHTSRDEAARIGGYRYDRPVPQRVTKALRPDSPEYRAATDNLLRTQEWLGVRADLMLPAGTRRTRPEALSEANPEAVAAAVAARDWGPNPYRIDVAQLAAYLGRAEVPGLRPESRDLLHRALTQLDDPASVTDPVTARQHEIAAAVAELIPQRVLRPGPPEAYAELLDAQAHHLDQEANRTYQRQVPKGRAGIAAQRPGRRAPGRRPEVAWQAEQRRADAAAARLRAAAMDLRADAEGVRLRAGLPQPAESYRPPKPPKSTLDNERASAPPAGAVASPRPSARRTALLTAGIPLALAAFADLAGAYGAETWIGAGIVAAASGAAVRWAAPGAGGPGKDVGAAIVPGEPARPAGPDELVIPEADGHPQAAGGQPRARGPPPGGSPAGRSSATLASHDGEPATVDGRAAAPRPARQSLPAALDAATILVAWENDPELRAEEVVYRHELEQLVRGRLHGGFADALRGSVRFVEDHGVVGRLDDRALDLLAADHRLRPVLLGNYLALAVSHPARGTLYVGGIGRLDTHLGVLTTMVADAVGEARAGAVAPASLAADLWLATAEPAETAYPNTRAPGSPVRLPSLRRYHATAATLPTELRDGWRLTTSVLLDGHEVVTGISREPGVPPAGLDAFGPLLGRVVPIRGPNGRGSGFVIGDGLVLTAEHVVDGASPAELTVNGLRVTEVLTATWPELYGAAYDAHVHTNTNTAEPSDVADLAILRVPSATGFAPLPVVRRLLAVQQLATAGFPHSLPAGGVGLIREATDVDLELAITSGPGASGSGVVTGGGIVGTLVATTGTGAVVIGPEPLARLIALRLPERAAEFVDPAWLGDLQRSRNPAGNDGAATPPDAPGWTNTQAGRTAPDTAGHPRPASSRQQARGPPRAGIRPARHDGPVSTVDAAIILAEWSADRELRTREVVSWYELSQLVEGKLVGDFGEAVRSSPHFVAANGYVGRLDERARTLLAEDGRLRAVLIGDALALELVHPGRGHLYLGAIGRLDLQLAALEAGMADALGDLRAGVPPAASLAVDLWLAGEPAVTVRATVPAVGTPRRLPALHRYHGALPRLPETARTGWRLTTSPVLPNAEVITGLDRAPGPGLDLDVLAERLGRVVLITGRANYGSGFILGDGLVLTAEHVVTGSQLTELRVNGLPVTRVHTATWPELYGDAYDARVHTNPAGNKAFAFFADVAMLEVPGLTGHPAIGLTRTVRDRQQVATAGYPGSHPAAGIGPVRRLGELDFEFAVLSGEGASGSAILTDDGIAGTLVGLPRTGTIALGADPLARLMVLRLPARAAEFVDRAWIREIERSLNPGHGRAQLSPLTMLATVPVVADVAGGLVPDVLRGVGVLAGLLAAGFGLSVVAIFLLDPVSAVRLAREGASRTAAWFRDVAGAVADVATAIRSLPETLREQTPKTVAAATLHGWRAVAFAVGWVAVAAGALVVTGLLRAGVVVAAVARWAIKKLLGRAPAILVLAAIALGSLTGQQAGTPALTSVATPAVTEVRTGVQPADPVRPQWIEAEAGSTLSGLAKWLGVSTDAVAAANPARFPDRESRDHIKPGERFRIPAEWDGRKPIRRGDTFSSIGRAVGWTAEQVMAVNPGVDPSRLRPGSTVALTQPAAAAPLPAPPAPPAPPRPEPPARPHSPHSRQQPQPSQQPQQPQPTEQPQPQPQPVAPPAGDQPGGGHWWSPTMILTWLGLLAAAVTAATSPRAGTWSRTLAGGGRRKLSALHESTVDFLLGRLGQTRRLRREVTDILDLLVRPRERLILAREHLDRALADVENRTLWVRWLVDRLGELGVGRDAATTSIAGALELDRTVVADLLADPAAPMLGPPGVATEILHLGPRETLDTAQRYYTYLLGRLENAATELVTAQRAWHTASSQAVAQLRAAGDEADKRNLSARVIGKVVTPAITEATTVSTKDTSVRPGNGSGRTRRGRWLPLLARPPPAKAVRALHTAVWPHRQQRAERERATAERHAAYLTARAAYSARAELVWQADPALGRDDLSVRLDLPVAVVRAYLVDERHATSGTTVAVGAEVRRRAGELHRRADALRVALARTIRAHDDYLRAIRQPVRDAGKAGLSNETIGRVTGLTADEASTLTGRAEPDHTVRLPIVDRIIGGYVAVSRWWGARRNQALPGADTEALLAKLDPNDRTLPAKLRKLGISPDVATVVARPLRPLHRAYDVHLHHIDYSDPRFVKILELIRWLAADGHLGMVWLSPIPQRGKGLLGEGFYYLVITAMREGIVFDRQMLTMRGAFADARLFNAVANMPAEWRWRVQPGISGHRMDMPGASGYLRGMLVAWPGLATFLAETTLVKEVVSWLLGKQAAHAISPEYRTYVGRLITAVSHIAGSTRLSERRVARLAPDLAGLVRTLRAGRTPREGDFYRLLTSHPEQVRKLLREIGRDDAADRLADVPDKYNRHFLEVLDGIAQTGQILLLHNDAGRARWRQNGLMVKGPPDHRHLMTVLALLSEPKYRDTSIVYAHFGGLSKWLTLSNSHLSLLKWIVDQPEYDHIHFDVSWNDVAQHIMASPRLRRGFVALVLRKPERFLFGTDAVKPVNIAHYRRHYYDLEPVFAEIEAGPGGQRALELLFYGNAMRLHAEAQRRANQWALDEIASGKWDDFIDELPAERRVAIREWAALRLALGHTANPANADGPGDWARNEQMRNLLGWHRAVDERSVRGRETARLVRHAIVNKGREANAWLRRGWSRRPWRAVEADPLPPSATADEAGLGVTAETLIAVGQANLALATSGTSARTRGARVRRVRDQVEAVERDQLEVVAAIDRTARRIRRNVRFAVAAGSVAAAGVAIAGGTLAEITSAGVSVGGAAFLLRGLLSVLRNLHSQQARVFTEAAMERGRMNPRLLHWQWRLIRGQLRHELRLRLRGRGYRDFVTDVQRVTGKTLGQLAEQAAAAPGTEVADLVRKYAERASAAPHRDLRDVISDIVTGSDRQIDRAVTELIVAVVVHEADRLFEQTIRDVRAIRSLPLADGQTQAARHQQATSRYSTLFDQLNRLAGAQASAFTRLNPHSGVSGKLLHSTLAITWLINLGVHVQQFTETSGLAAWVNAAYALGDLLFVLVTVPIAAAGLIGRNASGRTVVRSLQNAVAYPAVSVANALLLAQALLLGDVPQYLAALVLFFSTAYVAKLGLETELDLGRQPARKGPAASFMIGASLVAFGLLMMFPASGAAAVAAVTIALTGPVVYFTRRAWAARPDFLRAPENGPVFRRPGGGPHSGPLADPDLTPAEQRLFEGELAALLANARPLSPDVLPYRPRGPPPYVISARELRDRDLGWLVPRLHAYTWVRDGAAVRVLIDERVEHVRALIDSGGLRADWLDRVLAYEHWYRVLGLGTEAQRVASARALASELHDAELARQVLTRMRADGVTTRPVSVLLGQLPGVTKKRLRGALAGVPGLLANPAFTVVARIDELPADPRATIEVAGTAPDQRWLRLVVDRGRHGTLVIDGSGVARSLVDSGLARELTALRATGGEDVLGRIIDTWRADRVPMARIGSLELHYAHTADGVAVLVTRNETNQHVLLNFYRLAAGQPATLSAAAVAGALRGVVGFSRIPGDGVVVAGNQVLTDAKLVEGVPPTAFRINDREPGRARPSQRPIGEIARTADGELAVVRPKQRLTTAPLDVAPSVRPGDQVVLAWFDGTERAATAGPVDSVDGARFTVAASGPRFTGGAVLTTDGRLAGVIVEVTDTRVSAIGFPDGIPANTRTSDGAVAAGLSPREEQAFADAARRQLRDPGTSVLRAGQGPGSPRAPRIDVLLLDADALTALLTADGFDGARIVHSVVAYTVDGQVVMTSARLAEIRDHVAAGRLKPEWFDDLLAHERDFHLGWRRRPDREHAGDVERILVPLGVARGLRVAATRSARTGLATTVAVVAAGAAVFAGSLAALVRFGAPDFVVYGVVGLGAWAALTAALNRAARVSGTPDKIRRQLRSAATSVWPVRALLWTVTPWLAVLGLERLGAEPGLAVLVAVVGLASIRLFIREYRPRLRTASGRVRPLAVPIGPLTATIQFAAAVVPIFLAAQGESFFGGPPVAWQAAVYLGVVGALLVLTLRANAPIRRRLAELTSPVTVRVWASATAGYAATAVAGIVYLTGLVSLLRMIDVVDQLIGLVPSWLLWSLLAHAAINNARQVATGYVRAHQPRMVDPVPPGANGAVAPGLTHAEEQVFAEAARRLRRDPGTRILRAGQGPGTPRAPPINVSVLDARELARLLNARGSAGDRIVRSVVAYTVDGQVVMTGAMLTEIRDHIGAGRLAPEWFDELLAHERDFHLEQARPDHEHQAHARDLYRGLTDARRKRDAHQPKLVVAHESRRAGGDVWLLEFTGEVSDVDTVDAAAMPILHRAADPANWRREVPPRLEFTGPIGWDVGLRLARARLPRPGGGHWPRIQVTGESLPIPANRLGRHRIPLLAVYEHTILGGEPVRRAEYRATVGSDGLIRDAKGALLDGAYLFVIEPVTEHLYVWRRTGWMSHPVMLAGADVLAAGEATFDLGLLTRLSNRSGHYRPSGAQHQLAWHSLAARGANLAGAELRIEAARSTVDQSDTGATRFLSRVVEELNERAWPGDVTAIEAQPAEDSRGTGWRVLVHRAGSPAMEIPVDSAMHVAAARGGRSWRLLMESRQARMLRFDVADLIDARIRQALADPSSHAVLGLERFGVAPALGAVAGMIGLAAIRTFAQSYLPRYGALTVHAWRRGIPLRHRIARLASPVTARVRAATAIAYVATAVYVAVYTAGLVSLLRMIGWVDDLIGWFHPWILWSLLAYSAIGGARTVAMGYLRAHQPRVVAQPEPHGGSLGDPDLRPAEQSAFEELLPELTRPEHGARLLGPIELRRAPRAWPVIVIRARGMRENGLFRLVPRLIAFTWFPPDGTGSDPVIVVTDELVELVRELVAGGRLAPGWFDRMLDHEYRFRVVGWPDVVARKTNGQALISELHGEHRRLRARGTPEATRLRDRVLKWMQADGALVRTVPAVLAAFPDISEQALRDAVRRPGRLRASVTFTVIARTDQLPQAVHTDPRVGIDIGDRATGRKIRVIVHSDQHGRMVIDGSPFRIVFGDEAGTARLLAVLDAGLGPDAVTRIADAWTAGDRQPVVRVGALRLHFVRTGAEVLVLVTRTGPRYKEQEQTVLNAFPLPDGAEPPSVDDAVPHTMHAVPKRLRRSAAPPGKPAVTEGSIVFVVWFDGRDRVSTAGLVRAVGKTSFSVAVPGNPPAGGAVINADGRLAGVITGSTDTDLTAIHPGSFTLGKRRYRMPAM